jgi:hypothetical protein
MTDNFEYIIIKTASYLDTSTSLDMYMCYYNPFVLYSKCSNRLGAMPISASSVTMRFGSSLAHASVPSFFLSSSRSSTTVMTLPGLPNRPARPAICKYVSALRSLGRPSMKTCVSSGRSSPRVVAVVETSIIGSSDTSDDPWSR